MSSFSSVILATSNAHKVSEILRIWGEVPFEVLTLKDFPEIAEIPETGTTFVENALIKARAVSEKTGLMAVADDSGLEVDALDGKPGIYSARYAGEKASDLENMQQVIGQLKRKHPALTEFDARFRCVAALVTPLKGYEERLAEGVLLGQVVLETRGEAGFGYDPIFYLPALGKTLSELGLDFKSQHSHRYQAFSRIKELILESL